MELVIPSFSFFALLTDGTVAPGSLWLLIYPKRRELASTIYVENIKGLGHDIHLV